MGIVDVAFQTGDDALAQEFMVSLGSIPYFSDPTGFNVRITTFDIPEFVAGTYEYDYKSEHIVKPNGKNATSKEFSISFRVDKYYLFYKALRLWQAAIINPDTGGMSIDSANGISATRIPMVVTSGYTNLDGDFTPTSQIWSFTGCWPTGVGNISLDNQSGEPVICTARFSYLKLA